MQASNDMCVTMDEDRLLHIWDPPSGVTFDCPHAQFFGQPIRCFGRVTAGYNTKTQFHFGDGSTQDIVLGEN